MAVYAMILMIVNDDTVDWLKRTALNIWWQDRPKRRRRRMAV